MTKNRIVFLVILIFLFAVCSFSCQRAGRWLVKEDLPPHADALVILMGSFPERVLQAFDLYHDGRADRIIIVEESMGPYQILEKRGVRVETNSEQAVRSLIALGVSADSITLLPGDARSTLNEANAVRDYLREKRGLDTLILVSSPAHMLRASMIFKVALREFPTPILIGCSPSAYSGFNPKRWWQRKEDIQSVMSEYLKICSLILFEKRELKR